MTWAFDDDAEVVAEEEKKIKVEKELENTQSWPLHGKNVEFENLIPRKFQTWREIFAILREIYNLFWIFSPNCLNFLKCLQSLFLIG